MKPSRFSVFTRTASAIACVCTLSFGSAHAINLYWDGTGTDWGSVGAWSTVQTDSVSDPEVVPGIEDLVYFGASTVGAAPMVDLSGDRAALGLVTNSANAFLTTIRGGDASGEDYVLSLGASGINHLFGGLTIGSATLGKVSISLQGGQTWTSSASGTGSASLLIENDVSIGAGGNQVLTLGGTNSSARINGNISDGAAVLGITKTGSGIWTLAGTNTYSGTTTVNSGVLIVSNASGLGGSGGGTLVASGASLSLSGGITVSNESITISGIGVNNVGALQNSGGSNTWAGAVLLGTPGAAGTASAVRIGAASGNINVSGVIQDGASSNVAIRNGDSGGSSTGSTTFSGANTYTGTTHIVVGALNVSTINSVATNVGLGTVHSTSSNLGAPVTAANGTLYFSSGGAVVGQLIYNGTGEITDRNIVLAGATAGAIISQSGASGHLKFLGNITAPGAAATDQRKTLTLQGSTAGTGEIAGIISDAVLGNAGQLATSVTKSGTGTWTLSGANTYSGNTTITNGTLSVGSIASNLGGSPSSVFLSGGTLAYTGAGAETTSRVISLSTGTAGGGLNASGGGLLKFTANLGNQGAASTDQRKTLTLTGTGDGEFGGVLGDALNGNAPPAKALSISKTGTGTWTLSGLNTYTGTTTLTEGTLKVTNAASVGTGMLSLSGGIIDNASGGALTLTNSSASFGSFTFGGTNDLALGSGDVTYSGANRTITLDGADKTLSMGRLVGPGGNQSYTITVNSSAGSKIVFAGNAISSSTQARSTTFAGTGIIEVAGAITNSSVATVNHSNLAYSGTGTLILGGANTYTGTTTISSGTVNVTGNFDSVTGTAVTVNGGTLNLNNTGAFTLKTLTVSGGALTQNTANAISGTAALAVNSGAATLSKANNHTGGTTLSGTGLINIGDAGALGGTAGTLVLNGGTLDNTSGAELTLTANNPITVGGGFSFTGSNALNLGSGAVNLGGSQRTVTVNGSNLTFGGIISGTSGGGLLKAGGGSLTLAGANNFVSGVNLSAGTLNINNASALGTGTFTIGGGAINNTSGAAIVLSANNPVTVNGDFTFSTAAGTSLNNLNLGEGTVTIGATARTITLLGTGTTLGMGGAVNTFAGTQTLTVDGAGNRLTLAGYSLSNSSNNRTVQFAGSADVTLGAIVDGSTSTAGNLVYQGSGSLTLAGNNTYRGTTTIGSGVVTVTGNFDSVTGTAVTVNGGTLNLNNTGAFTKKTLTVSGGALTQNTANAISGTAALAVSSGTATLSQANNYSGATTLSGTGLLSLEAAGAINGSAVTMSGGTLALNAAGAINGPAVTMTGGTLTQDAVNAITGLSSFTLNNSALTQTFTRANDYSGATNVTNGIFQAGAANVFSVNSGFVMGTTATSRLDLAGFDQSIASIAGGGATGGGITLGTGNLTIGNNVPTTTIYTGVISGAGSVIKVGASTQTLTATNTFTGGLFIKEGTLGVGNNVASFGGNGSGAITLGDSVLQANATLRLDSSVPIYMNPLTVADAGTGVLTISNNTTGPPAGTTSTFGGAITLNHDLQILTVGTTGSLTFSGATGGTGNITVNNSGGTTSTSFHATTGILNNDGTITNTGVSTGSTTLGILGANVDGIIQNSATSKLILGGTSPLFTGSATISAGTLVINASNALNANNEVKIASGTTLEVNQATSIGGLSNLSGPGGTVTNTTGTARIITIGGSGAYDFGGNLTATTPANLALTVALTGGGSQTLTGTNTYTGATLVNSGTLALSGGSMGGTNITVGTGTSGNATLNVSGAYTIGNGTSGSLTVKGGTPSTGQGTLSLLDGGINSLTLSTSGTALTLGGTAGSASILNLDINGMGAADSISVGSVLSVGAGGAVINMNQLTGGATAGTYNLITYASRTGTGVFTLGALPTVAAGKVGGFSLINGATSTDLLVKLADLGATAYWTGSEDNLWNTIGEAGETNFTLNADGTGGDVLPGSISDVYFTANSSSNLTTTLGQDFTIRSLHFTPAASLTTIGGTNTLTIDAGGVNVDAASANHVISSRIALGANQTWTLNGTSTQTFTVSGAISGSSNLTLAGNRTLVLTGANTYLDTTIGTGSTLQIGTAGTVGTLGTGSVVNHGTLVISRSDNVTVANTISGAGALTKKGAGTTTLTGANTYSGVTTIEAGILAATSSSSFGTNSSAVGEGVVALGGGAVQLSGGITITGEALSIKAVASSSGIDYGITNLSGNNEWSGPITILGTSGQNARINSTAGVLTLSGNIDASGLGSQNLVTKGAGDITFTGNISGTNGIINTGTGTYSFLGGNTFTGSTAFQGGGTIQVTSINGLGTLGSDQAAASSGLGVPGSASNVINFGNNTGNVSGTLKYIGTGEVTDRTLILSGGGSAGGTGTLDQSGASGLLKFVGNVTNTSGTGAKVLALTGSTAGTGEISGTIQSGSGVLSVSKSGTGTWTLSGANTYTGATNVNAGTLLINGDQPGATGAVTVANGATLGGTGTVGGSTTIQTGGSLAAGVSGIGSQTFGSGLQLESGSIFKWEIGANGIGYDKVTSSSLTGAGAIFDISAADDFAGAFWDTNQSWGDIFGTGTYDLASIFTSFSGTLVNNLGEVAGRGTFDFGGVDGKTLTWTAEAVPEPTNALAGLLIAAGLFRRSRAQRTQLKTR